MLDEKQVLALVQGVERNAVAALHQGCGDIVELPTTEFGYKWTEEGIASVVVGGRDGIETEYVLRLRVELVSVAPVG